MESQDERIKLQEKRIKSQEEKIKAQDGIIKSHHENIKSQGESIKSQDEKVKCQEEKIKSQEERIKSQEERIKSQVEKVKFQEERIKSQEERIKCQEEKIKSQKEEVEGLKIKTRLQDNKLAQILQRLNQVEDKQGSSTTPFTDTYVWKVTNFSRRLQQARNNFYHELERCFYTSQGHKLKIFLSPNQYEFVAIYFATDEGNFDDTIQWPMKAIIEFCAIDTNGNDVFQVSVNTNLPENRNSFQKPPHYANGQGIPDFIPVSQVPLLNNTLTLKVKIIY